MTTIAALIVRISVHDYPFPAFLFRFDYFDVRVVFWRVVGTVFCVVVRSACIMFAHAAPPQQYFIANW